MTRPTLPTDPHPVEPRTTLAVHGGEVHVATATIHQAPPALVTEGTAHRVAGLGRDAADGAKTLRQLCRRGLPSVDSREGRVVVLADLLAWIREHGSVMPAEPPKAKPDDDDRELLRSAGVRLRAVGGR